MSVRVNLLPEATKERDRAARMRLGLVAAFLVLLLLIALVYWLQRQRLDAATAERDAAQEQITARNNELAQLRPFEDLERELTEVQQVLQAALGNEISFAGVLQDLAAVTPPTTALSDLDLTRVDTAGLDGEEVRRTIARIVAEGESLDGHAPGLERFLLELDKVQAFFGIHFTSSEADPDDPEVSIFTVEVDVNEAAFTGRYVDGIPEELR